ncbi:hypothetical protein [Mesorhizobium sp. KR1-2]|uniref:hypothetical protein n=1 Tax=Mesorhizobium sp. KR1-2 TaxID=3156609 RepID=UPI0032B42D2F
MSVYAVLFPPANDRMKPAVEAAFERRFEVAAGQILVAVEGLTTEQVAQKVGPDGANGQYMVMPVTNYWGWHDKNLWEWLKVNPLV